MQCRSGLGSAKARSLYLGGLWKLDPLILSTMFEKAVILCFLTRYTCWLFKYLCLYICPFNSETVSEWIWLPEEAFLMSVSRCLVNQRRKTIPSKSGLSNGILRWQQEVCKSQCHIGKGAQIVFHYKTGNGFKATAAAVPSIFCSLYLSHTHIYHQVFF